MEIRQDQGIPQDAELPSRPSEELLLPRGRTIRQVRAVYTDVVCETPELERILSSQLRTPRAVAAVGFELVGHEPQEVFVSLMLDAKHRLRGFTEVSRGTLTASLVHPREVFAPAIRELAAAVIVLHNHPSGDPEPSAEDLAVTKRLKDAGELLGIPLLDHVIIGAAPEVFVSLKDRRCL